MKLSSVNRRVLNESTGLWEDRPCYFINDVEVTPEVWEETWEKIKAKRAALGGGEIESGQEVNTLCRPACWPMESMALGCHPNRVAAENEKLAKSGSKCYHKENGKLVIPSATERSKVLKDQGLTDMS